MKILFGFSEIIVACNTIIALVAVYAHSQSTNSARINIATSNKKKRFRPAVRQSNRLSFAYITLQKIAGNKALVQSLSKQLTARFGKYCDVEVFDGLNSIELVRRHIGIALKKHSGIICCGVSVTQIAQEVSSEKKLSKPIVFINVRKSEMSALAYKYPLPHVTGIITERNFDAEIMYLKQLNPSLSSIGIIHGAGLNQLFAEEVILLESAIRKQNITPKRTSLSNGMLKNVDKEFLNNCDAIIILNNGVKQQQVQDIANYCDTTSKILCADTQYQHESIAINFNLPLEKTSHLVVDSMYELITRKENIQSGLEQRTLRVIDDSTLDINEKALKKQYSKFNPNLLFLLKNGTTRQLHI